MVSFLEPEKIVAQLDLKPYYYTAEFGCGAGGFTISLAKKLSKGMVYALDIQEEPLSALEGRARAEGLNNIKRIKCDLEEPRGSTLQDGLVDIVIVSNILFQSAHKEAMLKEAKRIAKAKGKIVIVDWKKLSPFGPAEDRVEAEDIKDILTRLELKKIKDLDAGTYHWGEVYEKD
jgi:ubiquinone/menaquinone biosynthesis C-methylase UbiE